MSTPFSDKDVIQKILDGHHCRLQGNNAQAETFYRECWGMIYARFYEGIWVQCHQQLYNHLSDDAADLVQHILLEIYHAVPRFNPDRGENISGWVHTIARNQINGFLRRYFRVRDNEELVEIEERADQQQNDPTEERISHNELCNILRRAWNELPSEDNCLLNMRYVDGLSFKEMAEQLGVKESTVRQRVHRIVQSLRDDFNRRM